MKRQSNLSLAWMAAATATWLLAHEPAGAAHCEHLPVTDRPPVGLALGGGGARGFAHVGVLRALEELRIPYDRVAGTSMGSIVGGMAATGMGSGEIAEVIRQADWADLFVDETDRELLPMRRKADDQLGLYGPKFGIGKDNPSLPGGVIAGQKILFMLESTTSQRAHARRFDKLPIAFRAIATDIVTGQMVILDRGSLAGAMRASMAVPGVFDPVKQGERVLVDGGLVRNLPVDVVRDMGAGVVIAVDVGTPLMVASDIRNVLSIIEQMTSLETTSNTAAQVETLGPDDVLIRPSLGIEITSASFEKFDEAAPLGYQAVMEQREELAHLSLSEAGYARWREDLERCLSGPPEVQFLRLDNRSRFADPVIEELISVRPGKPLDIDQLKRDIQRIYGLGFIRLARFYFAEEEGKTGIVIQVLQDERGTDFIETGLTISGSGRGTRLNLEAGYLKTDMDERGSELRLVGQVGDDFGLLADYYKYFDDRQRYIFNPQAYFFRRDFLLFDQGGLARANAEVDQGGLRLQFGREFGRHAVLFAQVNRYVGTLDVTEGPPVPSLHFNGGEWGLTGIYDRLDDLYLPTRGQLFELIYLRSSESLGADEAFEQLLFSALLSKTWGAHNMLLTARYNTTLDNDAPLYGQFTGGGFLNMSGFEPAELNGQHFGMVGAGYRYQVAKSGFLPGYLGATVEFGNAGDRREDVFGEGMLNGSLYFGYSTPIGPLYLGYGWSEDRSGLLFLRLGALLGGNNLGQR